jgi:hypothetical protein
MTFSFLSSIHHSSSSVSLIRHTWLRRSLYIQRSMGKTTKRTVPSFLDTRRVALASHSCIDNLWHRLALARCLWHELYISSDASRSVLEAIQLLSMGNIKAIERDNRVSNTHFTADIFTYLTTSCPQNKIKKS